MDVASARNSFGQQWNRPHGRVHTVDMRRLRSISAFRRQTNIALVGSSNRLHREWTNDALHDYYDLGNVWFSILHGRHRRSCNLWCVFMLSSCPFVYDNLLDVRRVYHWDHCSSRGGTHHRTDGEAGRHGCDHLSSSCKHPVLSIDTRTYLFCSTSPCPVSRRILDCSIMVLSIH
jgi:hypothetical protein